MLKVPVDILASIMQRMEEGGDRNYWLGHIVIKKTLIKLDGCCCQWRFRFPLFLGPGCSATIML